MKRSPEQKLLEKVTADPPRERLGREGDELREGWRALAGLLKETEHPFDAEGFTRLVIAETARRARWRRTRQYAVAAVAASVLFWTGWKQIATNSKPPQPQFAAQSTTKALDAKSRGALPVAASAIPSWPDAWDEEIADVRDEMRAVAENWRRRSSTFDRVQNRLDELESRLSSSSL